MSTRVPLLGSSTGKSSKDRSASRGDSISLLTEDKTRSLIRERDAQIAALQKDVTNLTNKLASLNREYNTAQKSSASSTPRRQHKLAPYGNTVQEGVCKSGATARQLFHERNRIGRNASIATANELNAMPDEEKLNASNCSLANRILDMFKDPASHLSYLNSDQFARDILKLNAKVRPIFESEPRVAFLQSPAYVFGDIHGNLEDLHFFSDNVWRLGMALTAGNFVFLGDYVDRGMSCLEVVAYLFAMKLLLPHKVFLLRGNHETRDVNGWEEHYGERSFIYQCRARFGDDLGFKVWEQTNQVFDRLPLAGVIDQDIFCVHGGIPRPVSEASESNNGSRIQDILAVPKVAGINPPYEHEVEEYQQVASDCIWSDPASDEQEQSGVDSESGFGESLRGGGAICFGHKAVTNFLQQHGFSYIMRAHEAHAEGVAVSKGARVFTVFSTSKDHNQGSQAMAGCILVDFEMMQVINRSPAYRNQYVHRRDSVSIATLTEAEIMERMRLGLVTSSPTHQEEFEEDHWDDFDEEETDDDDEEESSDDDDNYSLASDRRSIVDPNKTTASPEGASHDNHIWYGATDDADENGNLDLFKVDTSNRKKKRDLLRFSVISEGNEETDEEEGCTSKGAKNQVDETKENRGVLLAKKKEKKSYI